MSSPDYCFGECSSRVFSSFIISVAGPKQEQPGVFCIRGLDACESPTILEIELSFIGSG
jgi:hypothetical protein